MYNIHYIHAFIIYNMSYYIHLAYCSHVEYILVYYVCMVNVCISLAVDRAYVRRSTNR